MSIFPKCSDCGKELTDKKSKLCIKCKGLKQRGAGNPTWNGGRYQKKDGYILIYKPEHPNADKRHYVYEHVFVMSKLINRGLYSDEIVHHIDGKKDNNAPENLMLERIGTHIANNHSGSRMFRKEDIAMFVKRYEDGESSANLSKDYGCSQNTILYWVKKTGVKIKSQGFYSKTSGRKSKLTPEQWSALADEYQSKERPSVADLAKKYGISQAMVPRGLKSRGYELRKNRWH
jgi:transposase